MFFRKKRDLTNKEFDWDAYYKDLNDKSISMSTITHKLQHFGYYVDKKTKWDNNGK